MALEWKKCPVCNGFGEVTVMKSRVHILKEDKKEPLLKDEDIKCSFCQGKGNIYVKQAPFNPWNLFRKNEDE